MSDNIPFEIQEQIIKCLPVRSLLQFRSVSKTWKSLIDSSDFVTHYSHQHSETQHHLLVIYDDLEKKHVLIADDDTFPQQKVSVTAPSLVNMLKYSTIVESSHGLLCLYTNHNPSSGTGGRVVLWNLSVRKAVVVDVPNVASGMFGTVLGFGVCPETNDPKIVKITHIDSWSDIESVSHIPNQVEVFTLSTGAWRSPVSNADLPRKSIRFEFSSVVVDGTLYWLATDWVDTPAGYNYYILIIAFDVTSEEFREVYLPDSLAYLNDYSLSISKLKKFLVVVECHSDGGGFNVWMMLDGMITKIFSIVSPDASLRGFRKSGEPIVEVVEHHPGQRYGSSLVVYDPFSKEICNLGIDALARSYCVYPYIETLLLLDQPDSIIYDKGKATLQSGEQKQGDL